MYKDIFNEVHKSCHRCKYGPKNVKTHHTKFDTQIYNFIYKLFNQSKPNNLLVCLAKFKVAWVVSRNFPFKYTHPCRQEKPLESNWYVKLIISATSDCFSYKHQNKASVQYVAACITLYGKVCVWETIHRGTAGVCATRWTKLIARPAVWDRLPV